uniref:Uncharacterized protein n=1 Tax=Arundo donax TaxID=35708 RepID=A0A0A9CYI4_ARUDO
MYTPCSTFFTRILIRGQKDHCSSIHSFGDLEKLSWK